MRLVRSDDAGRKRRRRARDDRIFGKVTGHWPRCVRQPTLNSGSIPISLA